MNLSELKPGRFRVQLTDEAGTIRFNLSVVRDSTVGLLAVRGYSDGDPIPKRSRHYLLSRPLRDWLSKITLLNEA